MQDAGLRLETRDHTLVATIAVGGENLVSGAMMDALIAAIEDAAREPATRFVRIRAEGDVFCLGREPAGTRPEDVRGLAARIVRVNETLRTTPLTVIAEVQGDAAGFGAGLVGASDVAVAADHARFSFPEIKGGFAPTIVTSWARLQLPQRVAFEMISTGEPIDAATAVRVGLLTEAVSAGRLEARVDERIAQLAAMDAFALREVKRFMTLTRSMDPPSAARAAVDPLVIGLIRKTSD